MTNPLKMMGQVMRVQKQMKRMEGVGMSKDGLVKIKLNGMMKMTAVEVDESLLSPDSKHILESRIREAFKAAQKKIETKMRSAMSLGDVERMSSMMSKRM